MFEEHADFVKPDNPEQFIWRYIDFTKFVDLISTSELYFTRIDKLDDQFEGSHTIPTVKERKAIFKNMVESGKMDSEKADIIEKTLTNFYKDGRKNIAVNCWHMNNIESAAMWSLYSNIGAGIAIRSTYNRLKESLDHTECVVHIGKITYIDYLSDKTYWGSVFIPALCKGKSFKHEQELRALIWYLESNNKKLCHPIEHGVRAKVDIDKLVQSIFIAPYTPAWIRRLVTDVMNKYKFNKPINNSLLEGKPVY